MASMARTSVALGRLHSGRCSLSLRRTATVVGTRGQSWSLSQVTRDSIRDCERRQLQSSQIKSVRARPQSSRDAGVTWASSHCPPTMGTGPSPLFGLPPQMGAGDPLRSTDGFLSSQFSEIPHVGLGCESCFGFGKSCRIKADGWGPTQTW